MIHWEYIKGLNQYTQQIEEKTKVYNVFTFISFQNAVENESSPKYDFLHSPSIIISPENSKASEKAVNFGHIITELAQGQRIKEDIVFNNHVSFNTYNNSENKLNIYQNYIYREYANNTYSDYILFDNQHIDLQTGTFNIDADIKNDSGHKITTNEIEVKSGNNKDGSCTAVYFNATSDRRAKTDFSLLNLNALDLVKKVQLYSFKYKDSNLPSIGIIAQDIQDIDIKGFKLVDNENATGQDFDYMTIHESKLTYILWKAVQELSKEVEDLKKQLNK